MALSGYWMNGVCYETQAEAVNAFMANSPLISGQYLHTLTSVVGSSGVMSIATSTMDLSQNPNIFVSHSASLPLKLCDTTINTTAFQDGMSLGWGVVMAMVGALAVIFLKNSLFQR